MVSDLVKAGAIAAEIASYFNNEREHTFAILHALDALLSLHTMSGYLGLANRVRSTVTEGCGLHMTPPPLQIASRFDGLDEHQIGIIRTCLRALRMRAPANQPESVESHVAKRLQIQTRSIMEVPPGHVLTVISGKIPDEPCFVIPPEAEISIVSLMDHISGFYIGQGKRAPVVGSREMSNIFTSGLVSVVEVGNASRKLRIYLELMTERNLGGIPAGSIKVSEKHW